MARKKNTAAASSEQEEILDPNAADSGTTEGTEESAPEETPAEETASEETPSDETPSDETPSDETPADETPSDETPADETPADETPALDVKPDEAPAETAPVPTLTGVKFKLKAGALEFIRRRLRSRCSRNDLPDDTQLGEIMAAIADGKTAVVYRSGVVVDSKAPGRPTFDLVNDLQRHGYLSQI